jgi:hypothetical protein
MGGGVPMTTAAATIGLDWSAKFGGGRVPVLADWARQNAPDGLQGGEALVKEGLRVARNSAATSCQAMVAPPGANAPKRIGAAR